MKQPDKRALLKYLEKHNDGSTEAKRLIEMMRVSAKAVDCDALTIMPEDLEDSDRQEDLRWLLHKEECDRYTIEDCVRLAEVINRRLETDYDDVVESAVIFML